MVSNKFFYRLKVFLFFIFTLLTTGCSKLIVLNSKGPIGQEEAALIYMSIGAMLIVIVPVFIMTYLFVKRYRNSKKADYQPDWVHSIKVEMVIWLVPVMIVAFLSYLVWVKTYELDPYKPIASDNNPLNIQVVSLDWNWLFIYPDHNIAMVNELVIPEKVPLSFSLTSATVMTSFFIPQLGSQMYAMAGMRTRLHLMASETGTYEGRNIEFSGKGYDTMHFKVITKTIPDFEEWAARASEDRDPLDLETYSKLSRPSTNYPVTVFSPVAPELFNHVMQSFMGWMGEHQDKKQMDMDDMDTMKKGN
ncbi:ubiquinol oxidase subunit II [Desulfobacter vibrioformis]|uniref:ubiquinol oxidase subunit II n=1 Tax=Desulfobacter vibrioformis TaxID=34031 RepID=UPI000A019645|nr:ubiquinol oxidase subunit II [Desulfobacter vibrioformis]